MFATYNLTDFGSKLREIRISCGFTQSEVSKLAGIHEDSIRKIENGNVIPKYETLQYLTDIYKIDLLELLINYKSDKDLIAFVDRINEIIVNNKVQDLSATIESFNALLRDNRNFTITNKNEINKFHLYLKSIEEYFKNTEGSYLIAKNYLIEALSSNNKKFSYQEINSYKLNYFEICILLLLGINLFNLKETESSTKIMEYCLARLEKLYSKSTIRINMTLKLMYNLSHNYHIEDKHLDVLKIASSAIEIAIKNDTLFSLPHLFYRKGIAEYNLGINDYLESLKKSITLLDIYNNQELKEHFIKITSELYKIKLD